MADALQPFPQPTCRVVSACALWEFPSHLRIGKACETEAFNWSHHLPVPSSDYACRWRMIEARKEEIADLTKMANGCLSKSDYGR